MKGHFDVKQVIQKRKSEGKALVKFQVLGFAEKMDVTDQLNKLGYGYDVYNLREDGADVTPYDIIVEI